MPAQRRWGVAVKDLSRIPATEVSDESGTSTDSSSDDDDAAAADSAEDGAADDDAADDGAAEDGAENGSEDGAEDGAATSGGPLYEDISSDEEAADVAHNAEV
jgi:hypothetical protein